MTREEAIQELKEDIDLYIPIHGTIEDVDRELPDGRLITALEMGIDALSERKTGEWKETYAETDYRNGWIEFTCEFCEYQHGLESGQYGWSYGEPIPWKYCPCCGAKMQ